jgi:hypothetical protein
LLTTSRNWLEVGAAAEEPAEALPAILPIIDAGWIPDVTFIITIPHVNPPLRLHPRGYKIFVIDFYGRFQASFLKKLRIYPKTLYNLDLNP